MHPRPITIVNPLPSQILLISSISSVTVGNGHSIAVPLTVSRIDTLTVVNLIAEGLPPGLVAAFNPASLPGSNLQQDVTLTLTAAGNALAGTTSIQILATGAQAISAYAWISVTIDSPYSFVPGAPVLVVGNSGESSVVSSTLVMLAPFGNATVPMNLRLAEGLDGTVIPAVSPLPSGVTGEFTPPCVDPPPEGGYVALYLVLAADQGVRPAKAFVRVRIKVAGELRASFEFQLVIVPAYVSAVSPLAGSVPMLGQPGTEVTVTGGGLGPGTLVAFGADNPVTPSAIAADGTTLVVTVPPTAASGQLSVIPTGEQLPVDPSASSGAIFAVDNYRNTRGFSFSNNDAFCALVGGTYSFDDATALFGAGQTYWIYTDVVKVQNPMVYVLLEFADQFLGSNGQCFGMSLASFRFTGQQQSMAGLPLQPAGAEPDGPPGSDVWMLDGPELGPYGPGTPATGTNVSPDLVSYIRQQTLAQLTNQVLAVFWNFHASVNSADGLKTAILQAFGAGMGAMISMYPSLGEGHTVVAYGIEDTGGGNFNILVYDPNIPFMPAEDVRLSERISQMNQSVIGVTSGGTWVLENTGQIFSQDPNLPNWSGGISTIMVIPSDAIPVTPSFPNADILGLAQVFLWLVTGDAEVSQVSDGQGHLLLSGGQWNLDPATMLASARPVPPFGGLGRTARPAFASNTAAPLVQTITGQATGTYHLTWLGAGYGLEITDMSTAAGSSDTAVVRAGRADFTAGQDKALTVSLLYTGPASQFPRRGRLTTSAPAGSAVSFSFDPVAETFTYVHQGEPARCSLELSSYDSTGAETLFAAAALVGAGDVITFSPDWRQLADGVGTVTLLTASGELTSRPMEPERRP
jgi:hypothetical protein